MRSRLRPLVFAGLAALLAGCSSSPSKDIEVPEPLPELEPRLTVERLWRAGVGDIALDSTVRLRPKVQGDRVYVANRSGTVTALELGTGDRLWSHDLDANLSGGVGAGEGLVLVGSLDGQLFALDAQTGAPRWQAPLSSELLSPPAVNYRAVVALSVDERLHALDPQTGASLWNYDAAVPVLSLRGNSAPVLTDDLAIAGLGSGKLVAVGLDNGVRYWDATIAEPEGRSELERMIDVDGDPVLSGGLVFAVAYQGRVGAVDLQGRVRWSRAIPSHLTPAVDLRTLYVVAGDGVVHARAKDTGDEQWTQSALRYRRLSPPARHGDWLVMADDEGRLLVLDANGGELVHHQPVGGDAILTAPASTDAGLLLLDDGGHLQLINLVPTLP